MNEETLGNPTSPCNSFLRCRIKLTDEQLQTITLEDMIRKWNEQELYIDTLESQVAIQKAELNHFRISQDQMCQQLQEAAHKEKAFVRLLTTRAQEMKDFACQLAELKAVQSVRSFALRSAMLDPAVNLLMQRLRGELLSARTTLEETQNELSAWKFTPDSNTGKLLMAKCRKLSQENEELGTMICSGKLAKLEGELALQKSFSDEVKKSQSEVDNFLQDLDEDVEGMQSTIYYLQQELMRLRKHLITAVGNEFITH